MASTYDYSRISDTSKIYATNHINENPEQINAHIESFRRWLMSMPHLNCPTDADFLLKFLRVAKFDHRKAQKRLDNFCTVRSSPRGSPDLFRFFPIDDPIIAELLDLKLSIPLGRNDANELVVLVRLGPWNPDIIPFTKLLTYAFMVLDVLICEEETQIHGMIVVVDLNGVSRKSMESCSNPRLMKQWIRAMHDSYPMRVRGHVFYNEPLIFDIVYNILSFFMNAKIKSRTFRVKRNIKKAMEKCPGLEKLLPTEYRGLGGPIDECAATWNGRFINHYRTASPLSGISVDESKRSKETSAYLTNYSDYQGQTVDNFGTFTRIRLFCKNRILSII